MKLFPITRLTRPGTKRLFSRCISFAKGSHRDKLHYIGSGRTRGQFDHEDVFLMVKRFGKIDFVVQNTAYYFNPESPLSRASHANTSNAVVAMSLARP